MASSVVSLEQTARLVAYQFKELESTERFSDESFELIILLNGF